MLLLFVFYNFIINLATKYISLSIFIIFKKLDTISYGVYDAPPDPTQNKENSEKTLHCIWKNTVINIITITRMGSLITGG